LVEKVARDSLADAVETETATGVVAPATLWWLEALAVCPRCTTAG
jgi:hypothetical protein